MRSSWLAALTTIACACGAPAAATIAPIQVPAQPAQVARIESRPPSTDRAAAVVERARASGDRVEVEWHGRWWPATLVAPRRGDEADGGEAGHANANANANAWLIHYEGYDATWDEVVTPERIRDPGSVTDREDEPAEDVEP